MRWVNSGFNWTRVRAGGLPPLTPRLTRAGDSLGLASEVALRTVEEAAD